MIQQATMCLIEWNQFDAAVEPLSGLTFSHRQDAATHSATAGATPSLQAYVEAVAEWCNPNTDAVNPPTLDSELAIQVARHEAAWRESRWAFVPAAEAKPLHMTLTQEVRQQFAVWRESVLTLTDPAYGLAGA